MKNETTRYAPSEDVVDAKKSSSEEKRLKRLSFPIIPATLLRIKPKLKLSKSLQDVSAGNNVKSAISESPEEDTPRKNSDGDNDDQNLNELEDFQNSSDAEEESHYAVADIFSKELEEEEDNDSEEDEDAESKTTEKSAKDKRRNSAAKKAYKRMSFPLSGAFTKINNKLRVKTKSMEDVCTIEVENPYYAQSDIKRSSLEEITEGDSREEEDRALILCYNQGCEAQFEKSELQRHQAECKHVVEKCPNEGCGLELKRIDVNKHDIMECDYAVLKCKNSECHVTVLRKMMAQHLQSCEKGAQAAKSGILADKNTSKQTYETMTLFEKDEIIYASTNLLMCPAPRCLYQGAGSSLTQHICSQHSELLIKHLGELKNIFLKDEQNFLSNDVSSLYTKPCKKVAPTPRSRKSDEGAPLYSTPSKDSIEAEKRYVEVPLYTTPDVLLSASSTESSEYLTPIDGTVSAVEEHLYLTPVNEGGNKKAKTCSIAEQQGEYAYVSVLCKN